MTQEFKLNNIEEIERFEELLLKYVRLTIKFKKLPISLSLASKKLNSREDGGRIFTALLDLLINYVILLCEMTETMQIWNNEMKNKHEYKSVLTSEIIFNNAMNIHRNWSSFILRSRALWDKIMGIFFLLFHPELYNGFYGTKSRKKYFIKHFKKTTLIPVDTLDYLQKTLEHFDKKYRTPEAHYTGSLRKWSFVLQPLQEQPHIQLLGFWNEINHMIADIGGVFQNWDDIFIKKEED